MAQPGDECGGSALTEAMEKPLPKPGRDLVGYASARALEALLEALLALEFLGRGFTRNAAGKAFQAWRALTAALPALERDKVLEKLRDEQQRKWLIEKAVPRAPSSRLKALGQLLEDAGIPNYGPYTDRALDLHDYQYHGPDPEAELSKYAAREEAAKDTRYILEKLVEIVESYVEPRLGEAGAWTDLHAEALGKLKQRLAAQASSCSS